MLFLCLERPQHILYPICLKNHSPIQDAEQISWRQFPTKLAAKLSYKTGSQIRQESPTFGQISPTCSHALAAAWSTETSDSAAANHPPSYGLPQRIASPDLQVYFRQRTRMQPRSHAFPRAIPVLGGSRGGPSWPLAAQAIGTRMTAKIRYGEPSVGEKG